MSLITRCPACETMFKVVPDQLRISEGWVRCGQCEEVFDASAHLLSEPLAEVAAVVEADLPSSSEAIATRLPETEPAAESLPAEDVVVAPAVTFPAPGWAEAQSAAIEPVLEEFQVSEPMASQPWDLGHDRDGLLAPGADGGAHYAETADLSFMRGSQAGAFWRRPRIRAGLMMAGLLLCLGLAVQVVVHERDRLVAVAPGFKPLVEVVCAALQCAVSPLRQIDSVVIDSSSFNKIRGDVYRLNFTLKNTAVIELAVPAIELSLTDLQDQPLMRRVFRPDEVGLRSAVMPPSAEATGSLALSIKTNGSADRIAGYRILAFYP